MEEGQGWRSSQDGRKSPSSTEEGIILVLLSPEITSFPETLPKLIWPCTGPSLLTFNPPDRDSMSEPAHGRPCQRAGMAAGGWARARSPPRTGGTCIARLSSAAPSSPAAPVSPGT